MKFPSSLFWLLLTSVWFNSSIFLLSLLTSIIPPSDSELFNILFILLSCLFVFEFKLFSLLLSFLLTLSTLVLLLFSDFLVILVLSFSCIINIRFLLFWSSRLWLLAFVTISSLLSTLRLLSIVTKLFIP